METGADPQQGNAEMITTGTPKQIEWATKIRAEKMAKWQAVIDDLNTSTRARNQMLVDIMTKIITTISECTDAATWIDGRDNAGSMLYHLRKKDAALYGTDAREFRNVLDMMG